MADVTNPYTRRNSYNTQTRSKDVYSYEYLSKPFELSQEELPKLNANQGPNETNSMGMGSYMKEGNEDKKGKSNNMNGLGAIAQVGATALNQSSKNNKYQTEDDKRVSDIGNSVSSAIGPWWGAMTQAGEYTSKELKGDGTSTSQSVAGTVTDPWNAFKGQRKEENYYEGGDKSTLYDLGGNSDLGNFAINNLTGKNVWDAALGTTAKNERNYQERLRKKEMSMKIMKNDEANASASFGAPKYQALPYGKKGMKIKTKLSK